MNDLFLPTATLDTLRQRSTLLQKTRRFLEERGYWEVETPALSADVTVDIHLEPFEVRLDPATAEIAGTDRFYLQTSPEFAMKRLLVAGSGSIFQITKAFRGEEIGPLHNPEFTIIEWYRLGGHYHDLMTEVGELAQTLLGVETPDRLTYQQAFIEHCGLDPFTASDRELTTRCREFGYHEKGNRDNLLNFLLAERIEPRLGMKCPTFLYDFPPSQAALSQISPGPPPVAQRFELYINGIELCNGYQELVDPEELVKRNGQQNRARLAAFKHPLPEFPRLIEAMQRGLPECAGVAVGFDRLVMLATGARDIAQVLAFPASRA